MRLAPLKILKLLFSSSFSDISDIALINRFLIRIKPEKLVFIGYEGAVVFEKFDKTHYPFIAGGG